MLYGLFAIENTQSADFSSIPPCTTVLMCTRTPRINDQTHTRTTLNAAASTILRRCQVFVVLAMDCRCAAYACVYVDAIILSACYIKRS